MQCPQAQRSVALVANTSWYLLNFRRNLIVSLLEQGYRVVAIAPEDAYSAGLKECGAEFLDLPLSARSKNPLREAFSIYMLGKRLREAKADVVCTFTIKCNLYAGLLGGVIRRAQIANVSGLGEAFDSRGVLQRVISMLYQKALKRAVKIYFQNDEDMKMCIDAGLVREAFAERLPGSGVDLARFKPTYKLRERRVFLMHGRLVPEKGYDEFLSAAKVVKAKCEDRVCFRVLGIPDNSRPASLELLERIKQASDLGVVEYLGTRDDVEKVLAETDCVVLPSRYNEGVPRSLLEGLAAGCAVVTTDWKGCRDTVLSGSERNGFLVERGKVEELAQVLLRIAECPFEELAMMQRKSRNLAEQSFDEQLVIDSYLETVRSAQRSFRVQSNEISAFEEISANKNTVG